MVDFTHFAQTGRHATVTLATFGIGYYYYTMLATLEQWTTPIRIDL